MSDGTRLIRPPQCARPTSRTAAAVIAAAVLALLAAACSGGSSLADSGGSPHAGGSSSAMSGEPFSVCMRSHGVPRYPDPPSDAPPGFPAAVGSAHDVGVSPSRLQAAERACYHTLPINDTKLSHLSLAQCEVVGDCPPTLVQQALTQLENYARCMRSHGLPRWPDPTIGADGAPVFAISISKDGFDPYSSDVVAKDRICTRVEHPNAGGAPVAVSP
jgi:hypothetical protein